MEINSEKPVMSNKLPCIVADSAAFIRNVDLSNLGENIFTIGEVISEIRDTATKQRLLVLPYEIEYRQPSAESLNFVTEFSKQTGDYKSLSAVDLRVIALTYQLEKEFCDATHIRSEPTKKSVIVPKNIRSDIEISGFYTSKKTKSGAEAKVTGDTAMVEASENNNVSEELEVKDINNIDYKNYNDDNDDNDDDDDDEEQEEEEEGGWITPGNIGKMKEQMGMDDEINIAESDINCACLTTDFAMQNVMIKMGLHVLSVFGMLIHHARSYIQKCHGCNKETHNMEEIFCPSCGNKTLLKVAVEIADDGTLKYFYPKRRRNFNIRGTKFSIPAPKSGRHNINDVVLCADQDVKYDRLPKKKDKVNPLDNDYITRASPFTMNDVNSRAFTVGAYAKSTHSRNPNESKKKKKGRRR